MGRGPRFSQWLSREPRLTAMRIRRLLLPLAAPVPARTLRCYVAGLRAAGSSKEAFVHRNVRPATTMEVDFRESWVDIAGVPCKVKYLVATLPFSNAYFAKAYPVARLESLLDGLFGRVVVALLVVVRARRAEGQVRHALGKPSPCRLVSPLSSVSSIVAVAAPSASTRLILQCGPCP